MKMADYSISKVLEEIINKIFIQDLVDKGVTKDLATSMLKAHGTEIDLLKEVFQISSPKRD